MKFYIVRVNRRASDTYAAESLSRARELAQADSGDTVEWGTVEASDAGAARLMTPGKWNRLGNARMLCSRVQVNGQGYDSDGRYWGTGQPLYRYESKDGQIWGHLRANTRKEAVAMARHLIELETERAGASVEARIRYDVLNGRGGVR